MKRFMMFSDILELVHQGLLTEGLIIKSVATNQTLLLKKLMIGTEIYSAFCTEEREIVQTIDPVSVWELVNITFNNEQGLAYEK